MLVGRRTRRAVDAAARESNYPGTVEVLDEAMELARKMGYEVRVEAVEGTAGSCIVAGRKLLFVDAAASPAERLETVIAALGEETGTNAQPDAWSTSPTLRKLVSRRAA